MATLAVEPTARSTMTTTTSPNSNAPGTTTEAPTMRVRDLLINDLAGGAAQPPSPDDGFYSAAYFDNAEEEVFLQAQRAAFAEINDAALARAIRESELLAAQKTAEENRRRTQAGSGGSSSAASASRTRANTVTSAPTPAPPVAAGPYALVSPSELGSQRFGQPRRPSDAHAIPTSAHQTSSSSPPPSARSSPPLAQQTPSRSQYYTSATPSTSAYPSSSISLSSSNSPPTSRIHATTTPNTTTYRPTMPDRQRSSSQTYYGQQNTQQHQARPTMVSPSHSRRPSSTSVPTTAATAAPPTSYRQAAPHHSQPPSTIDPSTFYSNLSKTAPSSRKASVSSSTSPLQHPQSSSASRPSASRTVSSAKVPGTASNGASHQAAWYPTPSASSGGPSASIPSHSYIPSMPISMPKSTGKASSNASTMSTTPTSSSLTARDLRTGMLASIPSSIPSRSPEAKTHAMGRPASHSPPAPVRPPPVARPKRTRGRRVLTEIEVRASKAKTFLTSNFGKECEKCGDEVEGHGGSPSVPSEPFSHNLLRHLHVTCSNPECGATYCRGCFDSVDEICQPSSSGPTPESCRGGRGCDIKSCCTYTSVVALSLILDAFDAEFIRAAHTSGFASPAVSVRSGQAFVDLVISRGDKSTKQFEEILIRALHAIESWLKVFEERRAEYGDDEDDDDDVIDPSRHLLHPLITRSLLPSVFYAFLQNRNVGDWLKHSEIYVLILEVLRRLVDNGLRKVLDDPIVALLQGKYDEDASQAPFHWRFKAQSARDHSAGSTSESSSGAEDSTGSTSESERDIDTDATSPDEGTSSEEDGDDDYMYEKRKAWAAAGRAAQSARSQRSIKAMVTKLEEHRGPLMDFGRNVKFPATKVKVNCLCDGISYLLLQQVVAWD